MKKLSFRFSLVRSFLGSFIIAICSQHVSAWQVGQAEHPVSYSERIQLAPPLLYGNVRDTLTARSGKVSPAFIEGPNFVCHSAVFKVKNTTGSYEWSCNKPDLLSISGDGVATVKKGFGGLVVIRAKLNDIDNTTGYIDKTIAVSAHIDSSDLIISGDTVLRESGSTNSLYRISLSGEKKRNVNDVSAEQVEWGIRFPGEEYIHTILKSNGSGSDFPSLQDLESLSLCTSGAVRKTISNYFKDATPPSRAELVGRIRTPCGWSEWSSPLSLHILPDASFTVYPNPARKNITIESDNEFVALPDQIVFYQESSMDNVKTVRVHHESLFRANQKQKIDITVTDLNPGVYFLHLKSSERTKIVRVLVE